ncbi:hypothetical protein AVEN_228583-1 [Araneus ventricosus]|uniref:Uncharacterized protein n=1 Tax=Araneus ventricosus TaxID=182803 RepID=A0A4Y2FMV7_ARAVE|nr:hypothetical protein AVEN_228583-1 [Araneus ventricosus]
MTGRHQTGNLQNFRTTSGRTFVSLRLSTQTIQNMEWLQDKGGTRRRSVSLSMIVQQAQYDESSVESGFRPGTSAQQPNTLSLGHRSLSSV